MESSFFEGISMAEEGIVGGVDGGASEIITGRVLV